MVPVSERNGNAFLNLDAGGSIPELAVADSKPWSAGPIVRPPVRKRAWAGLEAKPLGWVFSAWDWVIPVGVLSLKLGICFLWAREPAVGRQAGLCCCVAPLSTSVELSEASPPQQRTPDRNRSHRSPMNNPPGTKPQRLTVAWGIKSQVVRF